MIGSRRRQKVWLLAGLALAAGPIVGLLVRSEDAGSPLGPRVALAAGETVVFIPTAAQLAGAAGTNWRTDLEIVNPAAGQASYTVALLKRDTDNSSPQTRSYTLDGGRAVRFTNVVSSMFSFTGAAALRITVNSGAILASSRTYNLMVAGNPLGLPAGATFGQFVPAFAQTAAAVAGENAYLIQLTHTPNPFTGQREGFRTNLGYVNATASSLSLTVDLYNSSGAKLGSFSDSLPPYGYKQVDKVFERVTSQAVADGYAIVRTTTSGGAFFAYASVVDNAVGDPIFVPAQKAATLPPAPPATPTPTRTPTPPAGARVNLVPYKPSGWDYPIVPSMESGTTTVGFLSVHYNTYVDWAVLNEGPDNIPGRINFELRLDGQRLHGWYTEGLGAGYYVYVRDHVIPYGTLTPGFHTLTIVADYDNQVAESNEADNSWGKSWEWTNILFMQGNEPALQGSREVPSGAPPLRVERRDDVPASTFSEELEASAGETVIIPTAAQLAGAAGTNWRTDLEIVNPGAAQASYTVALLKRDTDNSSPLTRSYTLEGGRAARYANVLSSMFAYSGAAALRITVNSGAILASSRTYNAMVAGNPLNLPAGSTFGQFVPAFAQTAAAVAGENAYLIQLTHTPNPFAGQREGFRTNLGYVNATAAALALTVDLYNSSGAKLGSFTDSLPAYGYKQVDKVFERVTSQAVTDGYAVVRTSTSGGAFIAYASVIDNITGDPVLVLPQRTTGGAPPTPTPTPVGEPLSPLSVTTMAFDRLRLSGTGGRATVESTIQDLQVKGLDGFINTQVQRWPDVLTKISNGVRADYGSGKTLSDGTVVSGSASATTTNAVITSTKVQGTVNVSLGNLRVNGAGVLIPTKTVTVDLTTDAQHHVSGTVSVSGSAQTPQGTATISGTVQVNTAQCARYPVGGSVTVTHAGTTKRVVFNSSCDGSFGYGGTLSYAKFDVNTMKCDGSGYGYHFTVALARDGNTLMVDPTCSGGSNLGSRDHRVTGSISATNVSLQFRSWYGDHYYQGSFVGTSSNGVLYKGTATYTVTAYNLAHDPTSGVRCQSQVFTSQPNDFSVWVLPSSYCAP